MLPSVPSSAPMASWLPGGKSRRESSGALLRRVENVMRYTVLGNV